MRDGTASVEPKLEQAARLLEERFHARVILLFGSRARDQQHARSDHDLAILAGRPLPDAHTVAVTKVDLEDLLDTDADLVLLDDASPILAMEILRAHAMLRCADPEFFESFVVRALGAYFDLKRVRQPIEAALLGHGSMTVDVALGNLATIERCLERIRTVTGGDPARVDDLGVEESVVLNLQRAIQATIDLSAHLISGRGWGLPDSLKAHFQILADHRVVSPELAALLRAMVGCRNIAVHDYERLDREILKGILRDRLGDLEAFARAVKAFLGL